MEVLPLCRAFAIYRAICRRTDPEDRMPGFDDDEMIDAHGDEMRRIIREAVAGATRTRKKRK